MKKQNKALGRGAKVLAVSAIFAQNAGAQGTESIATLEETVVVANRVATPLDESGSAVTSLSGDFLKEVQAPTLEEAMRIVPGVSSLSEGGQRGSISALRIRGAESDHTLTMIDGVRVSDSNLTMLNLFGADAGSGYGRVDLLRGPQSALYGSEAIGGVLSLETGSTDGEERSRFFAEVGSFDTLRLGYESGGTLRGLRWYHSTGYERTSNDRASNDFEQRTQALRLEGDLNDQHVLGMTLRVWDSDYENPGAAGPSTSVAYDEREAVLGTIYLESEMSDIWQSKATLGLYSEDFSEDGSSPFSSEGQKFSLDWRNTLRWSEAHQTVVGGIAELTSYESTATPVDEEAWSGGVYVNHLWRPVDGLTLSAGSRWEKQEKWDDVVTWRTTASWKTGLEGLRVHGSYGTGYRAPSFFERFGAIPSFGFFGDPNLQAEKSKGWDLGVEWSPCDSFVADVTYFDNKITNLIDFTPQNIGRATTRGVEFAARGEFAQEALKWRVAYTWMDSQDKATGQDLARRAKHSVAFDIHGDVSEKLSLGMGGTWLDGVKDNDFSTFPSAFREVDSEALLRVYGSYQLSEKVKLHARIENALDKDYEEIANYPGRGMGVFGGLTVEW